MNSSATTIALASGNQGKLREMRELLAPHQLEVVSQGALGIDDVPETGTTFIENALIKARHAALESGLPAIADDSGLVVDILGGAPGIHSARYAGVGASDKDNLELLLESLSEYSPAQRSAHFRCTMVFLRHHEDPSPLITEGAWDGIITREPKGENGFGYDPIFFVPTHHCTSAELDPETKNQLSHRGTALRGLIEKLVLLDD